MDALYYYSGRRKINSVCPNKRYLSITRIWTRIYWNMLVKVEYIIVDNGIPGTVIMDLDDSLDINEMHEEAHKRLPNAAIFDIICDS